jgi:DNA-directed RNA polymerase subunit H
MDEGAFIYNAWRSCIELAQDRGYIIGNDYLNITEADLKYLQSNKNQHSIDIISKINKLNSTKSIYIKFILSLRIKPSNIKEILQEIKTKINNDINIEILFILKSRPNNSILKLEKEFNDLDIQIMWCKQLQFNVTKHEYVPKHEKISEEESKIILTRYNLQSKSQLPCILYNDVIVRYYNFKPGDIIKITNTSNSQNKNYEFYRCVK